MPKICVGDVTLHYVESGGGEPLVLIMGFGGDHLAWGLQVRAFAERYRVVAFDNRGAGESDAPDVPYTTRMLADDTAELMQALGIARAHVIGLSMGGMIAQELALNHPERVRTLQLHATLARPDAYVLAIGDAWRAIRPRVTPEAWMRTLALWLFAPATYAERPGVVETMVQMSLASPHPLTETGFLRQGDAVRAHDALDRLARIGCPTLVSVAEEDILVPPRFSRELAERIPGAELRILAGAGHGCLWERPDLFNATCLEFLARHS